MFGPVRHLGPVAAVAALTLLGACGGRDAATFDKDAPADVPVITTIAKRPAAVVDLTGKLQPTVDLK